MEELRQSDIIVLGKLEQKLRARPNVQHLRQLHCNIFKGRRPAVPPIMCIAYKTRKSSNGVKVVVIPDTGATVTVVPWSPVRKLKLDLNVEDNDYNLISVSGDKMTVLGTVVIYLHPKGADTGLYVGL